MSKFAKVFGRGILAAAISQISFQAAAESLTSTMTRHSVDNSSIASSIASTESYGTQRSFKWSAQRERSTDVGVSWSDVSGTANGYKWQDDSSRTNGIVHADLTSSTEASQTGYRWGIRSDAEQSGYRWGIRSDAEQSGYRWGIRSDAEQSGYRWGIR